MKAKPAVVAVALGVLAGSAAWAQELRLEIGGRLGWTFSDGVGGGRVEAEDGNVYDWVAPQDSVSYGAHVGVLVSSNVELGFLWDRQQSKLEKSGTQTVEVDDMAVSNYHAYVSFNMRGGDASVRPYLLGGVGATTYGDFSFTDRGQQRRIESQTRFTTTWGLGMKFYPRRKLGLNLAARWTPTYIWYSASIRGATSNTRGTGWWCQPEAAELSGPRWGCYLAGNGQYSNQLELSAGLTLRF